MSGHGPHYDPEERFVGATDDTLVFLTFHNHEEYFSITGTQVWRSGETAEEIERQARQSVMDGEYDYLHREGMMRDLSLKEFREEFADDMERTALEGDYWEGPNDLWHSWLSTGQIRDNLKASEMTLPVGGEATRDDLEFILRAWNKYQLKQLDEVPEKTLRRLRSTFEKFPTDPTLADIRG